MQHTHTHTHTHACNHRYTLAYTYTHTHACSNTRVHTDAEAHACTHAHEHAHTRIHTGAVAVAGLGISWLAKNLGILESNTQAEEVASTVSTFLCFHSNFCVHSNRVGRSRV